MRRKLRRLPLHAQRERHVDRGLAATAAAQTRAVAGRNLVVARSPSKGALILVLDHLLRTAVVDQRAVAVSSWARGFGTHIEAARETYNYGTREAKASITRGRR